MPSIFQPERNTAKEPHYGKSTAFWNQQNRSCFQNVSPVRELSNHVSWFVWCWWCCPNLLLFLTLLKKTELHKPGWYYIMDPSLLKEMMGVRVFYPEGWYNRSSIQRSLIIHNLKAYFPNICYCAAQIKKFKNPLWYKKIMEYFDIKC